jgi:ribosome-associated translation inhibitor RaiA
VAKKIDEGTLSIEDAKKANSSYLSDFQKLDPELRKAAENQALLNTSIKSTGDTINDIDLGKAAIGLADMGENVNQLRLDFTDGTTAMGDKYNEFLAVLQQGEARYATLDKDTKEYYADAAEGIGGLLKEWVNYDTSFKTLTNEQIGLLEQYRLATDDTSRANIESKINEISATENQKETMLGYISAINSALVANNVQEQTNAQAVKTSQEAVRNEYKTTENSLIDGQSEVVGVLRNTVTEAGTAGTDTGNAYNTGIDSTNPGGNIASNIIAGIQDPELQAMVQEKASALGLTTGTNLGTEINNGIANSAIEETLNTAVTNGTTQAESTISTSASNIETNLSTTGTNISTNWSVTLSDIETSSSTTADNIYTYVDNLVTNQLTPLFNGLTDVIKQTFIDSVNEVESRWDSLTNSITSNMSSMKSAIDSAASSLDNLISKLKEAASAQREYNSAKASRSSSSNSGYRIQGYASGGVFKPNNPQLALLGDHKSQTEYALTTGHLQKIADMMANAIGSSGFEGNITIPIYVDGVLTDQKVITASQMHNYRSNGR